MNRILFSSKWTLLYKVVTLIIIIFLISYGIYDILNEKKYLIFILIWLIIFLSISGFYLSAKKVEFDDNYLFVNNYLKKRESKYGLEKIETVKVIFGMFSKIEVKNNDGKLQIIKSIPDYYTLVLNNSFDFLGLYKKLYKNEMTNDKLKLLKKHINNKKQN